MKADNSDRILDIAKRRGFFWQSSQIYGGIAGFYDYAHLGTSLKRKWENVWRNYFLSLDDNFYEISPSVIMPKDVFVASGHLESFVDPVVKCSKCKNVERADHLLETELKQNFEGISKEDMAELIKKHNIRCPKCRGELKEIGELNMMFPLNVGTSDFTTAYLTGETAQGAYVNFKLEFEALRKRLPMGLAVVGKAFRNEIAPRNILIRMREFSQAELQIFFDPDNINQHPDFSGVAGYKLRVFPVRNRKSKRIDELQCRDAVKRLKLPKFYVYHMARVQQFYLELLKLPKAKFRFKELSDDEKAFYNKHHWDVELDLPSVGGFREVAGVHYRTDHDLKGHQEVSKQKMEVSIDGKGVLPHVLELSFGVDRNVYALLELAYEQEKGGRDVLRFPRIVSPFDTAIFPLVNKDGLPEKARELKSNLINSGFLVFYDSSGSIGRRYRRVDEIGVAAALTVDHQTLKDDTVTLRDRDSMKQVRLAAGDVPDALKRFLHGERLDGLGRLVAKASA